MNRGRSFLFLSFWVVATNVVCGHERVSLDPRTWPHRELQEYLELEAGPHRAQGLVVTKDELIVATSSPFAVHAGMKALTCGGSAVDAALVTSLAQIVPTAGAWNSFAGILYLLYYDANRGQVASLNAGFNTVLAETEPQSIPRLGGRTALVPGFMAGVEAAHARYGQLPFADLFQPAIYLADEGVGVGIQLGRMIQSKQAVLSRRPETREIFTRRDGQWYEPGDRFRHPGLAVTLRSVAKSGASYMYTGPWARRLVHTVRSEGGGMTLEDLRRYQATWSEPLSADYGAFQIHTIPPPEVGGVHLIEALNVAEAGKLTDHGHYAQSAEALFWLMQISRLGLLNTFTPGAYRFDSAAPQQPGELSADQRLTKSVAFENWKRIQSPAWEKQFYDRLQPAGSHSDAVVVLDAAGNMAVVVHSINTSQWGDTGLFVDGVSIPDSAAFQQAIVQRVAPGTRLPNFVNPVIATRNRHAFVGAAAVNESLHEMMLQSLVDMLDFGMDPWSSLVHVPKFWAAVRQNPPYDSRAFVHPVSPAFPDTLLEENQRRGQPVRKDTKSISFWVGIRIDPTTGVRQGAASPLSYSWAEGSFTQPSRRP